MRKDVGVFYREVEQTNYQTKAELNSQSQWNTEPNP
jgi:hypothetical protein